MKKLIRIGIVIVLIVIQVVAINDVGRAADSTPDIRFFVIEHFEGNEP